jgi:hypothetical protein
MRKGLGIGKGTGYKNMIPKDPAVHKDSANGIKQPENPKLFKIPSPYDDLIGLKITGFRELTNQELERESWNNQTDVIQLSNGTIIYASRDEEGNDSGQIFVSNNSHIKTLNQLIGKKIKRIRPLTHQEKKELGWSENNMTNAIDFEDNITIYPSKDDEGNDGGTFFGEEKGKKLFYIYTKRIIE